MCNDLHSSSPGPAVAFLGVLSPQKYGAGMGGYCLLRFEANPRVLFGGRFGNPGGSRAVRVLSRADARKKHEKRERVDVNSSKWILKTVSDKHIFAPYVFFAEK